LDSHSISRHEAIRSSTGGRFWSQSIPSKRHPSCHDRRVTGSDEQRLARAVELREGGQLEQARELLLALRTEFPTDAHIAVQTAWVHDSLGLEEEAVSHYRAAIAGDLSDEELRGALLGLGSTLRTLGRDAEADDIFRLGIERFPDYRPLRVFYAMLRYNLGDPRAAITDLLRLLLESTSDTDILRYRRALTAYAEDLDRSWLA
jgi:predicted Zn-dependent protease